MKKIFGIITEYNPFHAGHLYQIKKIKSQYPDSKIVTIMSGNWLQRGEPALVNKWIRCQMALQNQVDLVIELPFSFACAPSQRFAQGGIFLLNQMNFIDELVFGSEENSTENLQDMVAFILTHQNKIDEFIHPYIKSGHSYAKARQEAIRTVLETENQLSLAKLSCDLLKQPNTILALEYLMELNKQQSPILPLLIPRLGSGYHSPDLDHPLASATSIRQKIKESLDKESFPLASISQSLAPFMPANSLSLLLETFQSGLKFSFLEDWSAAFLLALETSTTDNLSQIAYMTDSLPGRLKNSLKTLRDTQENNLWENLSTHIMTKHFSQTRIKRSLISLLFNQTQRDLLQLKNPAYFRILGFNKSGRYLLKKLKTNSTIPIITNASDFHLYSDNKPFQRMAELDLLSSRYYDLKTNSNYNLEFSQPALQFTEKRRKKTNL